MNLINLAPYIICVFLPISQFLPQSILPLTQTEIDSSICLHLKYESDNPDSFLIYRGYVVSYDYKNRTPSFTINALFPDQIIADGRKGVKRSNTFIVDDYNLRNKSATNMDYKYSGYDRGHMVPAGDFYWNKLLKDETFLLSNICPQNPNLNRGIWSLLEMKIRDFVIGWNQEAIVLTGTIHEKIYPKIGLNEVGVPNYFYKIIFFPNVPIM